MSFPQFKLRTLFVFVAMVAVGFAAYPRIRKFMQWYEVRQNVARWAGTLTRSPSKPESYVLPGPKGSGLAVMTVEPILTRDANGFSESAIIEGNATPDPKRFFVIPPGKWVDDIDQVIEAWDQCLSESKK